MSLLDPALRRSFQTLVSSRRIWCEVLAECCPLLESVGNLAEQMAAVSRVQISDTPLRRFPELQERLRFKLLQAASTVLGKLNDHMCCLQSATEAISNQVFAVLQQYKQSTDNLDLSAVTQRSAVSPSATDMLEWLQDAERHYRQQLLRRKALLLTLRPDDLPQLESAPQRWKSLESPETEQQISATLSKLSFFMASP